MPAATGGSQSRTRQVLLNATRTSDPLDGFFWPYSVGPVEAWRVDQKEPPGSKSGLLAWESVLVGDCSGGLSGRPFPR